MSRILAIDTATVACSAALWEEGSVRARRFAEMPRGQSEALMPMVAEVMAEVGLDYADLDLFAVTVGPGAFTGLRIGLAAARGMALAAGKPCLGVTTLEVVARNASEKGPLLVVLDSKRADLYAQVFDESGRPRGEPRAVLPEALGEMIDGVPVTVVGDAIDRALVALEEAGCSARAADGSGVPDAAVVAALAAERWRPDQRPTPPEPLYLRPPDAVKPKNGGRLRP